MYGVPARRLNMLTARVLPMKLLEFSDKINRGITYYTKPEYNINEQHGLGLSGSGIVQKINTLLGKMSPKQIAEKAVLGKIPTGIKSAINRISDVPNARSAFPNELHPISIIKNRKGKKRIVFNSFLGPNTQVAKRLRRGDKPVGKADAQGMRHDLEFALAKTPEDLRRADRHFIRSLQRLQKQGEPAINTNIGIQGIKIKNKLTDMGIWGPNKFLDPMKKSADIANAQRELEKLKQQGVGMVLPADKLRKQIDKMIKPKTRSLINPITKSVTPKDVANLILKRVVPQFIRMIAKKVGIKPKMFGKGPRNEMVLEFTKHFKKQFGGAIGLATLAALAPIGISAATNLTPLAIKLGKMIVPKIINIFKKMKGSGVGEMLSKMGNLDPRLLFGKAMFKIIGPIAKRIMKRDFPSFAKLLGMGGGAKLKRIIAKEGKQFVSVIGKILRGTKKVTKGIKKVVKGVKNPREIAKVLLNQALPALVGMIRRKTGIKPNKMGSGIKDKMAKLVAGEIKKIRREKKGGAIGAATLLGLAATAAPIVIPLATKSAKFLLPKIIGLFKRKSDKKLMGGSIGQKLIGMLKNIIMKLFLKMNKSLKVGKMMGSGIKNLIKNIGKRFVKAVKILLSPEFRKGLVKGATTVFKESGKIAAPVLKELGPLVVKHGLPLLIKALSKTG